VGIGHYLFAGLALGILFLAKPSFILLVPIALMLCAIALRLRGASLRVATIRLAMFLLGCAVLIGPWVTRNYLSVGKFGISEEYGSYAIVERFAFDNMTNREFALMFPFCLPAIGRPLVAHLAGDDAMLRFQYDVPSSFFHIGRERLEALIAAHGRIDPLIGSIIWKELRENWPRYFLVTLALGWCGIWIGWIEAFVFVPAFAFVYVRAVLRGQTLFLLFGFPSLAMIGIHALIGNHYTRYNLILIGPFAIASAWILGRIGSALFTAIARKAPLGLPDAKR
jgi:4-amino-4-deoxy-L-arabinose transferase-like glycosyltransferase